MKDVREDGLLFCFCEIFFAHGLLALRGNLADEGSKKSFLCQYISFFGTAEVQLYCKDCERCVAFCVCG